jgi:AraC-like DNA-binding protein/DNA-binding response OmpR family regulator
MIRIAIVDDEVLVRQGIKSYIESSGEDMEIAGTFSNAKDVIDFLSRNSIHVLITDIKMAQMNGVDLIRHCVSCLYPMGIIVLSCHDSFEYARDVFALGADAYLLKHEVAQQELISEIKRTYIRLRKTAAQPGQIPSGEASCELPRWPDGPFAVAKIGFRSKYERFARVKADADSKIVMDVVTEIVSSNRIGQVFLRGDDILFRIALDSGDREAMKEKAGLAAKHMCANMLNYFNERVYLAVSGLGTGPDAFQTAVEQTATASEAAFYDTTHTLFFFRDRMAPNTEHAVFHARPIDLQSDEWRSGLQADLEAYISRARDAALPPRKLVQNMQGFLYKLEDYLYSYYNAAFHSLPLEQAAVDRGLLEGMDNCDIVRDYVLFIADSAIRYVRELKDSDTALQRVVEYIDNHYASPVTLTMLSETFHINPSYLCKLFRDRLDKSFVYYLNEVRIRHARQLLAGSRLTVDEVAEKTGFNNANYFVRVFKKTTGMTIGEYRKK